MRIEGAGPSRKWGSRARTGVSLNETFSWGANFKKVPKCSVIKINDI